jgi:hypothetical protein
MGGSWFMRRDGEHQKLAISNSCGDTEHMEGVETGSSEEDSATEWFVLAEIEGAHGVFEINHVCWARADKGRDQTRKR